MTSTSLRRGIALLCCASTVLLLTACASAGAPQKDTSARALLDSKTGAITLPIDAYQFLQIPEGSEARILIRQANAVTIAECLQTQGFTFDSADEYLQKLRTEGIENRRYGFWDVQRAATYGTSSAQSTYTQSITKETQRKGPEWEAAYNRCQGQLPDVVAAVTPNETTVNSANEQLINRVKTEAAQAAQSDAECQRARDDWGACLKEHGLGPNSDEGWTSTQLSNPDLDEEGRIRVATQEAQCNQDVQLSQRLGDLEAAYQQPLIEQNQQALNEAKAERDEKLEALKEYVQAHG